MSLPGHTKGIGREELRERLAVPEQHPLQPEDLLRDLREEAVCELGKALGDQLILTPASSVEPS